VPEAWSLELQEPAVLLTPVPPALVPLAYDPLAYVLPLFAQHPFPVFPAFAFPVLTGVHCGLLVADLGLDEAL